ncbi:hypothetical protein U9M48_019401 [Paspalum notatum var. saurae]|uniref:Retrotransposon protein, putative, Ty3-gypsy subclass n=1 Tax=Paspalum notatum var. saurae TaxID=547442 RepID=A0AAQ3TDN5_PASNO
MEFEPTLEQEIGKGQLNDEKIKEIKELIKLDKAPGFRVDADGTVWHGDRICVPNIKSIRDLIPKEAHETAYSIHPGSEKMYQDLKQKFWWYGMKPLCDVCRGVKAEHQKPAGLLRPLKIPEWKWEEIGMDFIVGLPRTQSGFDSIWVVVDRLTKVAHFIPVKTTYSGAKLAELYMSKVRDSLALGSTGGEALFGPGIIEDAERQVRMIRENLRIAQTRQKSYADNRRRDLEFAVGDYVYLKVSPIRGLRRFKVKGKLAPRYIGPFKIIDRKGEVAYQLELPDRLSGVHNVFHISQLKNPNFGNGREDYRNRVIKMCKVKWSHHTAEEATWEREDDLRADYPELFASQS